jgi:2-(1,2-epoxy-1,2-dihydrophenyl)acetyl-CoA isomerase
MSPVIAAEISVERSQDGHVATVTMRRPPNNFIDTLFLNSLADVFDELQADRNCRVIVLAAEGKHFCAGRDFGTRRADGDQPADLYRAGLRIFAADLPWICAVQGGAIGGGFGLAMAADFRFGNDSTYFLANFARIGYHHGFGLTATLRRTVGSQRSAELLYLGERVRGREALELGLLDRLTGPHGLLESAQAFAARIALSAPLSVKAIRATLRTGLEGEVADAMDRELLQQERLAGTRDHTEGIAATREHRPARFQGA